MGFESEKPLRTPNRISITEADNHGWKKEAQPKTDGTNARQEG